ncbi:MAG: DUF4926 domain-containing protein [Anaerolineae bacterium]
MIELFQTVALTRDLPEHDLKRGDTAVLIDRVPHPTGGAPGCLLEVFNAVGQSLKVIAVPVDGIEALREDEILAVRPLAAVA